MERDMRLYLLLVSVVGIGSDVGMIGTSDYQTLPLFPGETENSNLKRISDANNQTPCVFCRTPTIDELNLGPLYIGTDEVVAHYFCLLFSSGLSQQGKDCEGILGFLKPDIMVEVRRSNRLRCFYCHKTGPTIGCCMTRCQASFHFSCGLRNRANFQYFGNFESFCERHSKKRTLETVPKDLMCPICQCVHDPDSVDDIIVGECCKSAVFHKFCIQQHALSAGYFFKCPTCNAQAEFIHDMKGQGIFVPQQNAAWEREPNAYEELLLQYSRCDATECRCPKGREYGASKGQWLLARCWVCGAAGTHRQCGKLTTIANWACAPCLEVETRTDKERQTAKAKAKNRLKMFP